MQVSQIDAPVPTHVAASICGASTLNTLPAHSLTPSPKQNLKARRVAAPRIKLDRRCGVTPLPESRAPRDEPPPARQMALSQLQTRENFLALSMSRPEMAAYQTAIRVCLEDVEEQREDLLSIR